LSLSFLQGTSYLIPLIIFPYLTRQLGIANYGLYALVNSVIFYFSMVVGYGFRLTATDKIAKQVGSDIAVHQTFWVTIFTKGILMLGCLAVLLFACFLIPQLQDSKSLFLVGFLLVIGNMLIPDFYFLGTQKMVYITIATTIGKIIYGVMVFMLVRSKEDVFMAVLSNSVGVLIIGLIAFYFAVKALKYRIYIPSVQEIYEELKEGLYVFFSIVSISFYSTINVILLGIFGTTTLIGYYSITEKIYKSLSSLVSVPFNMAVYPKLSKLYTANRERFNLRVKQFLGVLLMLFIPLALFLFFFAQPIVEFLVKKPEAGEIEMLTKLVKIISVALVFNPFGAFFSQQFIIKDRKKTMLMIILFLGIVNITIVLIFIPDIYMLIWAIVINRIIATILNGYFALKD